MSDQGSNADLMVEPFRLDCELAEALDGLCEAMKVSREAGIRIVLRQYLTAPGALDYKDLDEETPTVGSA